MAEYKQFTGVDDRVRLAQAVPLSMPFTLNIFPSNICNFRCNYCAQSLGKDFLLKEYDFPQEQMTVETVDRIVEQSKAFHGTYKLVSFMGHGEPLCNRKLPEMIYKIKQAGIAQRIDVITNASLLTREYTEELIDAGLDVMRVSLQGVSAEAYQKTSGVKIDFEKFIDNLTYFYQNKRQCRVYVKTVDASLEDGEDEKFYDLFSPISDRIFIDKVKPVYAGVNYSEKENDLSQDRYGNDHTGRFVCPQPFYTMSVWANGDVTPCCALYKACKLGNIGTNTLKVMWDSPEKKAFCRMQLEKKRKAYAACSKCCAPDDVSAKEDILDDEADKLIALF